MRGMQLVWREKRSLSKGFSNWIDKLIQPVAEDRFVSAKVALKFLRQPDFIFLKAKPLDRTLELQEIFSGKPSNSKLRIWESVDQFVCTFTKLPEKRESDGDHRSLSSKKLSGSLVESQAINKF